MTILIACDVGKSGAFSIFENRELKRVINMPILKRTVKEATYVYKHKDPQIVYKSGSKKGERPKVIKSKAKHKREIDFQKIISLFRGYCKEDNAVFFLYEPQFAIAHGKEIYQNLGTLLGIAMSYNAVIHSIRPQDWQEHFGYEESDKEKSVKIANHFFTNWEFDSHDKAESALIGKYFLDSQQPFKNKVFQ